jgi:hypothetical protein
VTSPNDSLRPKYDSWKEVTRRRATGEEEIEFRFYKAGQLVRTDLVTARCGISGRSLYWCQCESFTSDGLARQCPQRREDYIIETLTSGEFRYTSRASGRTYIQKRVDDNFSLP